MGICLPKTPGLPILPSMRICSVLAALSLLPSLVLAADAPGPDSKADEILNAFARFYSDAKTFQADLTSTVKIDAKGQKAEMESSFALSVERPNLLAFTLTEGQVGGSLISDGTTLITYLPMVKKYTATTAPKSLTDILDPMLQGLILQGLPFGHEVLFGPDIAAAVRKGPSTISYVGTSDVGGTAAHQLKVDGQQFAGNIWIASGEQPLLLKSEVALNLSAMPADMAEQLQITEFRRTTVYRDWKINQPIAASTFQFQPPADVEKVDSFVPKRASSQPSPLLGQPAPDFTLKDLTGQEVSLSSLRGKIVVIDFWATWCPPCVKGLPIVASVTSAFKDKDVVFYAINVREDVPTITAFLKSKSLDIPVLLDSEGAIGQLYGVSGIPQSYIIDKAGIIRAAHRGLAADLEKQLTEELTTLSSGGTLPAKE